MEKLLLAAAKVAERDRSNCKHFMLGAIALRRDGVLVSAYNCTTKAQKSLSGHAEARVLKKAGAGAILWVSRILRSGELALALPCRDCQMLIKHKQVEKVYYSIGEGNFGCYEPYKQKDFVNL